MALDNVREITEILEDLTGKLTEASNAVIYAAEVIKERLAAGIIDINISDVSDKLQHLQTDDNYFEKRIKELPEVNVVYKVPYAKNHGFSQHDCEAVYSCPSCGKLIGGWGDPVAEIGNFSIAMCTQCNEWFRTS